jgi:hypothetical protein
MMQHTGTFLHIGYRLLELQVLYKKLPDKDSWVWDFYMKGGNLAQGLVELKHEWKEIWNSVPSPYQTRALSATANASAI